MTQDLPVSLDSRTNGTLQANHQFTGCHFPPLESLVVENLSIKEISILEINSGLWAFGATFLEATLSKKKVDCPGSQERGG